MKNAEKPSAEKAKKGFPVSLAVYPCLLILPYFLVDSDWGYYLDVISRIFIFALFATGLDLLMGYGRLASMGHALFFGIGAYSVGILGFHWGDALDWNYLLMLPIGLLFSGLVAVAVGRLCLATGGVFFIMLTLAFGQLTFFLLNSLRIYGGEDGLIIDGVPRLYFFGEITSEHIYYLSVSCWFAGYAFCKKLLSSPFGLAYAASACNERKASSMGFLTQRYKLVCFVLSALFATVAGSQLALLNLYVSPALMHWSKSAEALIMVVLGGLRTFAGGFWGAAAMILAEEFLAPVFVWWHIILGMMLVAVVMIRKGGIYHLLKLLAARIIGSKKPQE